jgi:predicted AAA+ superfamily ATPase
MKVKIERLLEAPDGSFFLFGPRGTGKSTWLKDKLPEDSLRLDLLDNSLFLELSQKPETLNAMTAKLPEKTWVIIDEIQKIPSLLDEVHRLIQDHSRRFALCGSSARKLRRKGINLLAGRAVTRNMESFSFAEVGTDFDISSCLEWGLLPFVHNNRKNAADILNAYVNTYIKEEIREEGVIRNLAPFLRFLGIAGLLNGQVINSQNIARDAAVARSNIDNYFSILNETLLGHWLPAYRPRLKVREQAHPKFYWFDPGVARGAAGLLYDAVERPWKGMAMETLIFHELRVFNETNQRGRNICYYRTQAGSEIDFIVETRKRQLDTLPQVVCIEVKLSDKWDRKWENAIRSLKAVDGIEVDRMIGIYTGSRSYHFDGFDVLPVREFLAQLHAGKMF